MRFECSRRPHCIRCNMSGEERKVKSAYRDGWGILNRFGDLWTPHVFDTEAKAQAHFEKYWREFPKSDRFTPPAWCSSAG